MTTNDELKVRVFARGQTIGTYMNREIPAFIIDEAGAMLTFERLATPENNGLFLLDQLADDEAMLAPGLVYRKEGSAT